MLQEYGVGCEPFKDVRMDSFVEVEVLGSVLVSGSVNSAWLEIGCSGNDRVLSRCLIPKLKSFKAVTVFKYSGTCSVPIINLKELARMNDTESSFPSQMNSFVDGKFRLFEFWNAKGTPFGDANQDSLTRRGVDWESDLHYAADQVPRFIAHI